MHRRRALLVLTLLWAALAHADYVDRVIASVNGSPVLWSDVEREVRVEELIDGAAPGEITFAQRNQALNRMMDALLLGQQLRESHARVDAADEELRMAKALHDLRAKRHMEDDGPAWQALLRQYGLTEADLDEHLKQQLEVLQFVDLRFRPGALATPHQIDEYYKNVFVPEMKKRGAAAPPLKSVQPRIEAILLEQNIDESMAQWLKAIRGQADIWRAAPFDQMGPSDTGESSGHGG